MIEEYAVIRYNKNNEIYFSSIGLIPEFADFYGVKDIDKIYKVKFEVSEDQSEPDWNALDYWGWLNFDDNKFTMIWANYKLFHCCFTYGVN